MEYYRDKFYQENPSTSTLWKNVNDYLNTSNRSFSNTPNVIIHENKTHTKPRDIANALNNAFLLKVKKLKEMTSNFVSKDPKERLREFLNKRNTEIEEFKIKKISKEQLRLILKKRKGNRSCGIDFIDGYSIKLAASPHKFINRDVILWISLEDQQSLSSLQEGGQNIRRQLETSHGHCFCE